MKMINRSLFLIYDSIFLIFIFSNFQKIKLNQSIFGEPESQKPVGFYQYCNSWIWIFVLCFVWREVKSKFGTPEEAESRIPWVQASGARRLPMIFQINFDDSVGETSHSPNHRSPGARPSYKVLSFLSLCSPFLLWQTGDSPLYYVVVPAIKWST
jgi:hypothetical protein